MIQQTLRNMNNNKIVLIKLKILSIETALSAYRCSKCGQASMLTIQKLISTQLKTNRQEMENWDGWRDGVVLKQRIGPYKRGPLVVQIFKELDYCWIPSGLKKLVCASLWPSVLCGSKCSLRCWDRSESENPAFVHTVFPEPLNTTEGSMLSSKPCLFLTVLLWLPCVSIWSWEEKKCMMFQA